MKPEETELIKSVQATLDALRNFPQYREYIEQHKLSLINSNLKVYDELLDKGIIH